MRQCIPAGSPDVEAGGDDLHCMEAGKRPSLVHQILEDARSSFEQGQDDSK
jgi:hypothetical protein